jgi:hypothetical protein
VLLGAAEDVLLPQVQVAALESSVFTDSVAGSVPGVSNSLVWLLLMQVWFMLVEMVSICSLVVDVL